MSLKASILLVLVGTAYSLRCQCSSEAGGVRCYNGWCDVQDFGGKVGACALVRVGTRQHFACVRVKPTSQDTCKVDQKNGETLVRCWCRSQDYCNTDLSDRIDDDKEVPGNLVADEADEATTGASDSNREDIVIERNYDIKDEDYLNKYDSDGSEDDDLYPPPPHHKIATTTSTTTTTPRPTVTTTIYPPWRRQYPAEQPEPLRPQYPMRQLEQSRPEYPAVQPARRPDYPAIRPEQQPQPPPPVPPLPQADPYQLRRQLEEEHRRRMQEYYNQQRERQKALELERKKETTSSTTTTTTTTVPPIVFPRRPVPADTNIQARPEVQARPDPRRLEELERQRHEEMLRREQEQIVERARAQAEARARVLKQNVTRPRAWIKGTFGDPKPTAADTRPAPPVLTFRRYRPFDLNTLLGTTAQVVSVDESDGDESEMTTTMTPRVTTTSPRPTTTRPTTTTSTTTTTTTTTSTTTTTTTTPTTTTTTSTTSTTTAPTTRRATTTTRPPRTYPPRPLTTTNRSASRLYTLKATLFSQPPTTSTMSSRKARPHSARKTKTDEPSASFHLTLCTALITVLFVSFLLG